MLYQTAFIQDAFIANGAEWKVSLDGEWIMLVCDLSDEIEVNHINPSNAWNKEVQDVATEHRSIMIGL